MRPFADLLIAGQRTFIESFSVQKRSLILPEERCKHQNQTIADGLSILAGATAISKRMHDPTSK